MRWSGGLPASIFLVSSLEGFEILKNIPSYIKYIDIPSIHFSPIRLGACHNAKGLCNTFDSVITPPDNNY